MLGRYKLSTQALEGSTSVRQNSKEQKQGPAAEARKHITPTTCNSHKFPSCRLNGVFQSVCITSIPVANAEQMQWPSAANKVVKRPSAPSTELQLLESSNYLWLISWYCHRGYTGVLPPAAL